MSDSVFVPKGIDIPSLD